MSKIGMITNINVWCYFVIASRLVSSEKFVSFKYRIVETFHGACSIHQIMIINLIIKCWQSQLLSEEFPVTSLSQIQIRQKIITHIKSVLKLVWEGALVQIQGQHANPTQTAPGWSCNTEAAFCEKTKHCPNSKT